MKKVIFSVSKAKKDEKVSGVGYLADGNLLIAAISNKGNPYIRVFEDVLEKCKPVSKEQNEFKGDLEVIYTDVPVFKSVDHDNDESKKGSYEILDSVSVTYHIWFKYLD